MEPPPRRFLCARCRAPVLVCSHCDRGQRYCAADCAVIARKALQQEAAQRYQCSRSGRLKHAQRTRRWRERQATPNQSVTHQGSPPPALPALLPSVAVARVDEAPQEPGRCHFCPCCCGLFVRIDFLRRRIRRAPCLSDRKEFDHARDP